jgi:hypothetical protein
VKILLLTLTLLINGLAVFGQEDGNGPITNPSIYPDTGTLLINGVSEEQAISSLSTKKEMFPENSIQPGLLVKNTQIINDLNLNIDAYSIPPGYMLYVQVEVSQTLFDYYGKLLKQQRLSSINTEIPMENLPNGKYTIKIVQQGKDLKTYEILKK